MTQRLYFDDAYLRSFTARVIQRGWWQGQPAVVLDRSAFYPEGGGQPGDRGTLNGVAVRDTQADAAGMVWHVLAAPLDADEVHGTIDWPRRFDYMQQHHGQHLLSAAAEQVLGARTRSARLGEEHSTIDLDRDGLNAADMAALEDATNAMVWADVPILARFVSAEELSTLRLRKPPQAHARIRIVSAGDFDHSACGGTHPRRTGEVGCVAIRRWERYKGGTRITFVCGGRVVRDVRNANRLLRDLAARFSVSPAELPAALERLAAAEAQSRAALERAEARLLELDAHHWLTRAEPIGATPVVVAAFEDCSLDYLRNLARRITEHGGIALLGLRATPAQLVFARPPTLAYDMSALLREAAALLGGGGGGRPDAAQGGGPNVAYLDQALHLARERLAAQAAR